MPFTYGEIFFKYNPIIGISSIGKGNDQGKDKKNGSTAVAASWHNISSIHSGFSACRKCRSISAEKQINFENNYEDIKRGGENIKFLAEYTRIVNLFI